MSIIFILLMLIISLISFSFLWVISPWVAFLAAGLTIAIILYLNKSLTDKTFGKITQRACPNCSEINQSRQELMDWNCYKCGALIPVKIVCPDCGILSVGTITDRGVKAALCNDCYNKLNT